MLLITGATGLVGGLVGQMLPGEKLGLCRFRVPDSGLTWIRGDVGVDGMGLSGRTRQELQRTITGIVHCAADVRFTVPLEQARNVNTAGTARLLEFARACPRLRHFAHVSTVYVLGAEQGTLPEGRAEARKWISSYEQSKYEAEALVLDAAATLPASIYRLSSVVGDAATGRVRQFNHVHQMLRLMPRHLLPAIPGDPEAPMDLIPSDAVGTGLAHLIGCKQEPGTVWNLCAGSRSWTLGEIIEATVSAYHAHGHFIRGPRLIGTSEFASLACRFTRLTHDLMNVASHFLPHLALRQHFASERTDEALASAGLTLPHISAYFARVMRYCFETQWGNGPAAADCEQAARPIGMTAPAPSRA
jgi:nucleoside-diphosphate-sugar epimerase